MPINRRVVAVAYDDLCTFEFGVAAELFGLSRPEMGDNWYSFEVVSPDPSPLRALGGITLSASTDLAKIETAGTVLLPGWRDPSERPPEPLLAALRRAHANGSRLMSICSGVFVLAATGLLDGQPATTHWRYTDQLQREYPEIEVQPDVLYVDNGTLLTSAGSAAGLDLGLHLIRRDFGAEAANLVARRLVVAPHREGGQAQFISHKFSLEGDTSLTATTTWAIGRLDQQLSVADLAEHAAMTPRTFARRFRDELGLAPLQWLTHQRVLLAQELLETTQLSIDLVAHRCGFGSAATLRHHFARVTQTTPSKFRQTFSRQTG